MACIAGTALIWPMDPNPYSSQLIPFTGSHHGVVRWIKKTSPIWALCLIKNTKLVGQKLSLQQLAIHPMNNPIMQSVSQLVKTLQWIIYTWWLWSFHSWYTLGMNPIVNPCSINSHWPFTKIEVSYNLHIVTGWWFQTCLFSIIYGIILPID